MDDFAGPSFFDYTAGAHSSMSSSLELHGTGLDSIVKQETFDSSTWIQGCSDFTSGIDFEQQSNLQTSKTDFLPFNSQMPMGLESIISGAHTSNTPQMNSFDSLEMILNQPPIDNIPVMAQNSVSTSLSFNNVIKTEIMTSQPSMVTSLSETFTHDAPQGIIHDAKQEVMSNNDPQCSERTSDDPAVTIIQPVVEEPEEILPKLPEEVDPEKDLNLYITNVVTSFRVRCHLNLRKIAQEGMNVIYQKEAKKIIMRIRRPSCTAYMWSSGKIICTGANSEDNAKRASRKFARKLQELGFQVIFSNFKVINVLAVCKMPFHIDITKLSEERRSKYLSYEPEIHPAVTYRMSDMKVTFKIFSTGSITLTCPVVARIPEAVKKIYPIVKDFFRRDKPNDLALQRKQSSYFPDEESDSDS